MNLNQTQYGARKSGGTNPNLTESPYIAAGVEGSVQYRGTNGALDGDSNFIWNKITRFLSVLGSLFIKSTNSISGNALEVQNSSGVSVLRATNTGYVLMNRFGASEGSYFFNNTGGFEYYISTSMKFRVYSNDAQLYVPLIVPSITCGNYSSAGNTTISGNNVFLRSNDITSAQQATLDIIGGDNTGAGNSARVRVGYKKTGVENFALDINEKDIKIGFSDGKHSFYGGVPVAKQNLSASPTNAELATILSNLGLVNIV